MLYINMDSIHCSQMETEPKHATQSNAITDDVHTKLHELDIKDSKKEGLNGSINDIPKPNRPKVFH